MNGILGCFLREQLFPGLANGFATMNYGFAQVFGTVAAYTMKQKPKNKPTKKKKKLMKQVAAKNKVNEDSMSDYDFKVP
ncbi:MAG: hypothetical protein KDC25_13880, partial [Saprospiraceae bacterium]|nr:hypothetical protein [Saprospiraceae bacterium]